MSLFSFVRSIGARCFRAFAALQKKKYRPRVRIRDCVFRGLFWSPHTLLSFRTVIRPAFLAYADASYFAPLRIAADGKRLFRDIAKYVIGIPARVTYNSPINFASGLYFFGREKRQRRATTDAATRAAIRPMTYKINGGILRT